MATEAVPQASLEPQHDPDLINYDADIQGADKEWSFPNTGVDSADITDMKNHAVSAASSHEAGKTDDSLNEIDWEDHGEPGDNEILSMSAEPGAADVSPAIAPPFDVGVGESDSALAAEPATAGMEEEGETEVKDLQNGPGDGIGSHQVDEGEGPVEHEITYEEDEVVELQNEGEDRTLNEGTAGAGSDEYAGTQDATDAADDPGYDVDEAGPDEAAEDIDEPEDEPEFHNDQLDDEPEELHGEPDVQENPSTDQSQDDAGVLPPASLDITVTYKNEEYPLIHGQEDIDTQMGFFENASALDLTIDNLLPKFREELTDDLGPEDEVVLQIDELGLEYAESTHRDHVSGVTLRQLHEIFDQLAKNQEPDASRTLYTNLIIRPHPAKRLEMLIDEAFNGKGLDEITYCFQPNISMHHPHDEDEEMYESSENEAAQSPSAEDEEGSQDEDSPVPDDDVEDRDGRQSFAEYRDIEEAEEVDAGDADGDIEQYDDFGDLDTDNTAPPQAPQYEEPDQMTGGDSEELDIIEVDGADLGESTTQNEGAHDGYNAEQNADGSNAADDSGFDLVEIADDDDAVGEADRAESSATVTLTGDRENEIDFDENDLNEISNDAAAVQGSSAEPLNEIDWRDFAEEGESGLNDTLSSSAKRPRPDGDNGEDLLAEDQNDVKRRRS